MATCRSNEIAVDLPPVRLSQTVLPPSALFSSYRRPRWICGHLYRGKCYHERTPNILTSTLVLGTTLCPFCSGATMQIVIRCRFRSSDLTAPASTTESLTASPAAAAKPSTIIPNVQAAKAPSPPAFLARSFKRRGLAMLLSIPSLVLARVQSCPRCGSRQRRRSSRCNLWERFMGLLIVPWRCCSCDQRFFRFR
jgi:hypothetical protein